MNSNQFNPQSFEINNNYKQRFIINEFEKNNTVSSRENFDIPGIPSMQDLFMMFVYWVIKMCIFGLIIYLCYSLTGYKDDVSISYMFLFMFIGSIVMFGVTILYFMYKCYNNDVSFSDMDYKQYAISAVLGPVVIIGYAIFVFIADKIKATPLLGFVLFALTNFSFLVVLFTGFIYSISFETAYALLKCSKK
jgi:hypothetical protein